jgi:hypothetical protein
MLAGRDYARLPPYGSVAWNRGLWDARTLRSARPLFGGRLRSARVGGYGSSGWFENEK